MKRIQHMSINLQGCLNNHKRKKIKFMQNDDGSYASDKEARAFIKQQMDLGHKLMPMSDNCEGFDPFGGGCPGHPVEE